MSCAAAADLEMPWVSEGSMSSNLMREPGRTRSSLESCFIPASFYTEEMLVLASQSPRRREILRQAGIPFHGARGGGGRIRAGRRESRGLCAEAGGGEGMRGGGGGGRNGTGRGHHGGHRWGDSGQAGGRRRCAPHAGAAFGAAARGTDWHLPAPRRGRELRFVPQRRWWFARDERGGDRRSMWPAASPWTRRAGMRSRGWRRSSSNGSRGATST